MTPPASAEADRVRVILLLSWVIWTSQLAGLVILYFFLGRGPATAPSANPLSDLSALIPLFISIVLRWLVLPRYAGDSRAFAVFVIGCALAEVSGLMGLLFSGPYRDDMVVLAALGIVQYVPFSFQRIYREKPPADFTPNN